MSENVLPMISSRTFMVPCIIFKSLICFGFLFVYGEMVCSTSLIYMGLSGFPYTPCWRSGLFPVVYHRPSVKYWFTIGVWLCLWAVCSVPLIHMPGFVPVPHCFDYDSFVELSDVWEGYASSFVLFLLDYFGNSGSFMILFKFLDYLF